MLNKPKANSVFLYFLRIHTLFEIMRCHCSALFWEKPASSSFWSFTLGGDGDFIWNKRKYCKSEQPWRQIICLCACLPVPSKSRSEILPCNSVCKIFFSCIKSPSSPLQWRGWCGAMTRIKQEWNVCQSLWRIGGIFKLLLQRRKPPTGDLPSHPSRSTRRILKRNSLLDYDIYKIWLF